MLRLGSFGLGRCLAHKTCQRPPNSSQLPYDRILPCPYNAGVIRQTSTHTTRDDWTVRRPSAGFVAELNRFYELNVYQGAEPDQIRLDPSEIERAKSDGFFLVVVSNVEGGQDNPKVRIITDALNQLERIETVP